MAKLRTSWTHTIVVGHEEGHAGGLVSAEGRNLVNFRPCI